MELMHRSYELMERIKELECLHRVSALVHKRDLDLSQLLTEIAQFIPSALQYPESACARIVYEGKAYCSSNFRETSWKLISVIHVADHMTGTIEICYLEEKKEENEGPFLTFERKLIESIARLLGETIERRKAEEEAASARRDYQSQLRTLASQLSMAEQQERLRIATELHDGIAQSLAMTKMKLSAIQQESLPPEVVPQIDELRRVLEGTIRSTRSLSFDLSPPVLQDLGLEPALEWLTERTEEEHTIKFAFEDDGEEKPLDENLRNLLFVMVRELVMNVVKHAKAKEAKISIWRDGEQIQIEVQDQGRGFEVTTSLPMASNEGGFGLFSIRERLRYFGGRLVILSRPGNGTSVRITAPLKLENEDKKEQSEG
jgi:signal transduction histidine kinase